MIGVDLFCRIGMSGYVAKLLVDILLYMLSFVGQRLLVFRPGVVKRKNS